MMYLLQDPTRQAEIHEMALVICAAIGFPALEGIVSLCTAGSLAFGESLLDVRQLLTGGKVPLVKQETPGWYRCISWRRLRSY